jgi:hypothetical protein
MAATTGCLFGDLVTKRPSGSPRQGNRTPFNNTPDFTLYQNDHKLHHSLQREREREREKCGIYIYMVSCVLLFFLDRLYPKILKRN